MDFNLVTIRLRSDVLLAPHFEVQRLSEGNAYYDLHVTYVAFNSGQRLFEAQRLLQEVWEALIKQKIVEGSYSNALNYHEKKYWKTWSHFVTK